MKEASKRESASGEGQGKGLEDSEYGDDHFDEEPDKSMDTPTEPQPSDSLRGARNEAPPRPAGKSGKEGAARGPPTPPSQEPRNFGGRESHGSQGPSEQHSVAITDNYSENFDKEPSPKDQPRPVMHGANAGREAKARELKNPFEVER